MESEKLKEIKETLETLVEKAKSVRLSKTIDYNTEKGVFGIVEDDNGIQSQYAIIMNDGAVKSVAMLLTKGFKMFEHNHVSRQEFFVVTGSIKVHAGNDLVLTRGGSTMVDSFVLHTFEALEDSIVISNLYAAFQF